MVNLAFVLIIVLIIFLLLDGGDDDNDRPHTGVLGDIWQNKNQIFVGVIFLTKNILNLVQRFKI